MADARRLALWINTATKHVDDAQFQNAEVNYGGGYLPKQFDLHDKHVAGRITVPEGTELEGKPMVLQLEVDLPVTPLVGKPAPRP